MDSIFVILGWIVMATLALAIARQLSEQKLVFQEGFTNGGCAGSGEDDGSVGEGKGGKISKSPVSNSLTAKTCYETDFISQTQLAGDYTQRTNNFKHAKPDNCSAPLTEFVNKFY
jgi:hypothetical protein